MTAFGWVSIGAIAGGVLVALSPALRSKPWAMQADNLARQYDIELPPGVADRVARRMRTEYLLGVALMFPLLLLFGTWAGRLTDVSHPHRVALTYAVTVLSLPLLAIVFSAVLAIPAWNAGRERRVTHLVRPTPWHVFTRTEWIVVGVGVAVTLLAGAWGFWRVDAGWWWLAWLPALAASAGAWWSTMRAIMQRPARASDNVELGWDDVLRYRQARQLTIGAALMPGAVIVLVDFELADSGNLIPIYAVVGAGVALAQVFKRGRSQWRQSWKVAGTT